MLPKPDAKLPVVWQHVWDIALAEVVEYSDCKLLRRQLLRAVGPQAELTWGHHHHHNWNGGFVFHCQLPGQVMTVVPGRRQASLSRVMLVVVLHNVS